MTSPLTEGPIAPPQPAAIPPNAAPKNITINLSDTESKKGMINIPPKETPVKARLKTHNLIFPNFLESGIQRGTDKAEGSM